VVNLLISIYSYDKFAICVCFVVIDGIVDHHCLVAVFRIVDIDGFLDNHSVAVMSVLLILPELLMITA
jgi:hypothetical protein